MKIISFTFILILSLFSTLSAKYLDSKSCKECHEDIYYEHSSSMHHNSSLFKDTFHKKVKETTTPENYSCALCHIPASSNLRDIITGEQQPSSHSKREMDGVSCFYCHQITKVLETKHRNINFYGYKENTKPTFLGNIDDYGDSDKHNSDSNEIFSNSQVCMGCHGKKYNKNQVQICNGYNEFDKTSNCIKCHMPKYPGGTTKLNKKGRTEYSSHSFLGIRDEDMVKQAVELKLKSIKNEQIELIIKNKMGHSIIMQPMRLKFVETTIERDGNIIWKNYEKEPIEDKRATFTRIFKDDSGKQVFPPVATQYIYNNNLKANSSVKIIYDIPKLKSGDTIKSRWISYIVRPTLAVELDLSDREYTKKYVGYTTELVVK